jgi:alternate signal-mediated exported protein
MNKLLKGAMAGAAGVALLLGGAGTFAMWNDSTPVAGGTIVAGNLDVADSGTAGSWSVNGGAARPNLTGFTAVPGDTLVYTKTISVTASGDNLSATLSLSPASITASSNTTADTALAAYLTKTAVLTATGTGISTGSAPYTITAGTAGVSQDVTVTVTITFPKSTTVGWENDTMLGSVSLNDLTVVLKQV